MAISIRATGVPTPGTNSVAIPIPAAQVTGDMMLLLAGGKPYNSDTTTTVPAAGWAQIGGFYRSGTTAAGIDTGSMWVGAWWKVATSDTEANPTLTEGATAWNVAHGCIVVWQKAATELWTVPVIRGGGDEADPVDITVESNPGIQLNDAVSSWVSYNTDAATPCTTHVVQTATGVTFSNTHDPSTDVESTAGGDWGMCINRATVTAGPSTAVPHITSDPAAAMFGAGAMVLLRVFPNLPIIMAPHRAP